MWSAIAEPDRERRAPTTISIATRGHLYLAREGDISTLLRHGRLRLLNEPASQWLNTSLNLFLLRSCALAARLIRITPLLRSVRITGRIVRY